MPNSMKLVIMTIISILCVIIIGIGIYKVKRWVNWNVGGYGSQAREVATEQYCKMTKTMVNNQIIQPGPNYNRIEEICK